MYTHAKSRRPWRGSATVSWVADKMMRPQFRPQGIRGDGNDGVIYKTARTKQRRLDDWLTRTDTGEWDD